MLNQIFFKKARRNMVYNQLIPSGITNENLIDAFLKVPRHNFILSKWKNVSYTDSALPICNNMTNSGRFMMPTFVIAKMYQFSNITLNSKVLDFYCNTCYSSSIISHIAKKVVAVDTNKHLLEIGVHQLSSNTKNNILFQLFQDFYNKVYDQMFDLIIVNGIMNDIPDFLKNILVETGQILLIQKKNYVAKIVKYIKYKDYLFQDDDYVVDVDERFIIKETFLSKS